MDYTSVSHYPTVVPETELDKLSKLILNLEAGLAKVNIAYANGQISLEEYSKRRIKIFNVVKRMRKSITRNVKSTLTFIDN